MSFSIRAFFLAGVLVAARGAHSGEPTCLDTISGNISASPIRLSPDGNSTVSWSTTHRGVCRVRVSGPNLQAALAGGSHTVRPFAGDGDHAIYTLMASFDGHSKILDTAAVRTGP